MTRPTVGGGPGHERLAASAVAISDAITSRAVSCVEVVEAHLSRIEAVIRLISMPCVPGFA